MEKQKKTYRPRLEVINPTHIVDVWRLAEHAIRDDGHVYPDNTEDSNELIRAHMFEYLQLKTFRGYIAKIGKRPVGVLFGDIRFRAYGLPSKYMFVHCGWVDPQFRKQGVGRILISELAQSLKKEGIFHWECLAQENVVIELIKKQGVSRLLSVVGGKIL